MSVDIESYIREAESVLASDDRADARYLNDVRDYMRLMGVPESDVMDLDLEFYRMLRRKGLTPEQAAREDACL